MHMLISDFDFNLPKHLIAQSPSVPRDYAKLLVYKKLDKSISIGHFFDVVKILKAGDVLVLNDTKVIPSRLLLEVDGFSSEIFFLKQEDDGWKAMVRPGKRFKIGKVIKYKGLELTVESIDEDGHRSFSVNLQRKEFINFLKKYGVMPVPPYISGKQYENHDYNTIYSHKEGSVAAPTAGLHFSKGLLNRLASSGVIIEYVTLNVGLGTFLPVKENDVKLHKMHHESYAIDFGTAKRLNRYKQEHKRIIAVGTTSVRSLEDNYKNETFREGKFNTNIFIKPGYNWQAIDGMITNFHLPKSTLLMLVSAMIGRDETMRVYHIAKKNNFRFFSFGDAMIII